MAVLGINDLHDMEIVGATLNQAVVYKCLGVTHDNERTHLGALKDRMREKTE